MALLNLLISISLSILFHKLSPALGVNEKKLILQLLDLIKTTVAWNASPGRFAKQSECGVKATE